MKNGYLERDYEYLTKVGFIKSEYENPRLNLVISTIDKNKMYGGLSTAVKLYRYLAEYLEMDMRIIMTAEVLRVKLWSSIRISFVWSQDRTVMHIKLSVQ